MIVIDQSAPSWAHRLVTQINQAFLGIDPVPLEGPYSISSLPDPTNRRWLWRQIALSDGAGGIPSAICNGTDWVYPDGTAI